MNHKKPPFTITAQILDLSQKIAYALGKLEGRKFDVLPVHLRKQNSIKTLCASLAIEGNTLSLAQVTDIFDGKRVVGAPKEILEVKNAIQVYERFDRINPLILPDMLTTHEVLMRGLISQNGKWRSGHVGIFKGSQLKHMPPPADRVPHLMQDLFEFLKEDSGIPSLLKACIFHYELEFIHPFSDGNGRMGRLWQQLILASENPIFRYLPVEELIQQNQADYYDVLGSCDREGDSTKFISFSLSLLQEALEAYEQAMGIAPGTALERLSYAKEKFGSRSFSRKEYLSIFPDISSATASRDLLLGVRDQLLQKQGEKNQALYTYGHL